MNRRDLLKSAALLPFAVPALASAAPAVAAPPSPRPELIALLGDGRSACIDVADFQLTATQPCELWSHPVIKQRTYVEEYDAASAAMLPIGRWEPQSWRMWGERDGEFHVAGRVEYQLQLAELAGNRHDFAGFLCQYSDLTRAAENVAIVVTGAVVLRLMYAVLTSLGPREARGDVSTCTDATLMFCGCERLA